MKRVSNAFLMAVLVVLVVGTPYLAGCAGMTAKGAPETVNCDAEISWEIVKEAKLNQFDCALGESGGQQAIIFTVGLENASGNPQRYRLNIFLEDMDKAFGHLVPRKGNPPVLEPGGSETVIIPFIGTDRESKKILVVVKTVSVD